MNETILYGTSNSDDQLKSILTLQKKNLERNISKSELKKEGYVTAEHNLDLLSKMNNPYPHVIATLNDKVVGYTLIMTKSFSKNIPVLIQMFEKIDAQVYRNISLGNTNYVVMGQVCIDKPQRGKGIFYGLYQHMSEIYRNDFDYMITMIADRNKRSLHAHYKVGFKPLHHYESHGEQWHIVILDWHKDL